MAFKKANRVKETSTTTGTGTYSLGGAVTGFQTFVAGIGTGNTCHYCAEDGTNWEVGIGTVTDAAPDTLARTVILKSSNADAAVNWGAGTKNIFLTHIAEFERDTQRLRKNFYLGLGSDSAAAADYLHIGMHNPGVEGTFSNNAGDADGQRKNFITSATINTDAGFFGPYTMCRTDFNPDVTVKFKINSATQRRVWIGWFEADPMGADTNPTIHSFGLRLSTAPAVTGFTIVHSNGTSETVESQIQAADTNIHTIRLVSDNNNARWGYSFDGAAMVWITSNIPAATALVGLQIQIRCLEAASKNMDFWFAEGSMDK